MSAIEPIATEIFNEARSRDEDPEFQFLIANNDPIVSRVRGFIGEPSGSMIVIVDIQTTESRYICETPISSITESDVREFIQRFRDGALSGKSLR